MRSELSTDLLTHQKHEDTPIFHRIKFDDTSIYLTKTTSYELMTSKNNLGHYRIFSWTDQRSKAFLGFELGQRSPALGAAKLIGMYKPDGSNLRDVKYSSEKGKMFYRNAQRALNGEEDALGEDSNKIDAENFMKMAEIIPTGVQGKAIYGEGNYIIDGPAGTGKSTTVLQKIKLLQLHENIDSKKICVVVKNQKVVDSFKALLKNIVVKDISILTVDKFMESSTPVNLHTTKELLSHIHSQVGSLSHQYQQASDITLLTAIQIGQQNGDVFSPIQELDGVADFKVQKRRLIQASQSYLQTKLANDKSLSKLRNELRVNSETLKQDLTAKRLAKNNKPTRRLFGLLSPKTVEKSDELPLSEHTLIRSEVDKFRAKIIKAIDRKKKAFEELQSQKMTSIKSLRSSLDDLFYSSENLSFHFKQANEFALAELYMNKHYRHQEKYHSIIIDEAQDVAPKSIELMRLHAQNLILAGDESQKENPEGVGKWEHLINKEMYCTEPEQLNIYRLTHNFRQTYELGVASYNYRQLILGRETQEIKSDYFEDQIGFSKPELKFIQKASDFTKLVDTKLDYIKSSFTSHFPLVIFYENNKSLLRLKSLINNKIYRINVDDHTDKSAHVLFVSIKEVAGREFPVVIAPLANITDENSIYVMLSRAKFSLTLVTGSDKKINKHINSLRSKNLISTIN